MNLKDNLLSALSGEKVDITPVVSVTQLGTVEAMDKLGVFWPEAHKNSEDILKLGASLYEYAGLECIRFPFDLTVEAEAMGAEINYGTKERPPEVSGITFESSEDMDIPDDYLENGRIPVIIDAIELAKEKYGGEVPIIVGVCGPFTLAGHLLGVENLVRDMVTDSTSVEDAMDICLDACMDYADLISETEVDVVCVAEPTASPDLINPIQFNSLIKGNLEDYAGNLDVASVLHICGSTQPIVKDMASLGYDGISVEEKLPFDIAKKELEGVDNPSRLVGNVSTSATLFNGTTEQVKAEAKDALDKGADVLAPSCGIAPLSPIDNIKSLVEARNEYFKI
ncbi:methylcobamide:CoM methyltransferase MtaA [Methanobrevibacter sp. DSM 116169]|uniref:methylcobamide:CoM methyltransferase MtaA n=1 Tax=Methanobrevibacter sp. DSM 116169 TaxID=3242727 RepID=UPI0038FC4401